MPKKPSKGKSSALADYILPAVDAKYNKRFRTAKDIGIEELILKRYPPQRMVKK